MGLVKPWRQGKKSGAHIPQRATSTCSCHGVFSADIFLAGISREFRPLKEPC